MKFFSFWMLFVISALFPSITCVKQTFIHSSIGRKVRSPHRGDGGRGRGRDGGWGDDSGSNENRNNNGRRVLPSNFPYYYYPWVVIQSYPTGVPNYPTYPTYPTYSTYPYPTYTPYPVYPPYPTPTPTSATTTTTPRPPVTNPPFVTIPADWIRFGD